MKSVVIVDFDNYFPGQMSEYPTERLETFFNTIISDIIANNAEITEIIIRLYGGWYQGNGYSRKASELQATLQGVSLFPIIIDKRRIVGSLEMAEQMYGVNYTWTNTFQEKAGIQKVKIDWTRTGSSCTHSAPTCPVKILSNFMKHSSHQCSNTGCSTIQSDVFFRREQKIVDTMMTCDVLSFSEEKDINIIYIISDDIDLFPSIALSKAKNEVTKIIMVIKNQRLLSQYQSVLSTFNAEAKIL